MNNFYTNPAFLFLTGFLVLELIYTLILHRRIRNFETAHFQLLEGEDQPKLSDIILKQKKQISNHSKNFKELGDILEDIIDQNKIYIQKVSLVRFNPFRDVGGNMSFALVLLDGQNNGMVLSSLHSREGVRIYAKPILAGESEYQLTDEELQAIDKAVNKK